MHIFSCAFSQEWRAKVAKLHQLTYASTVTHLRSALRKLVRVQQLSVQAQAQAQAQVSAGGASSAAASAAAVVARTLYRGVRGEVPPAFWER